VGLIYLYETTGTDAAAATVPVRLSTGAGYNQPTAPGYFEPAILAESSGIAVQRSVFAGQAFGAGDVELGDVSAANDGRFDALLDLGFGQAATLKLGDNRAPYESFATVVSARCRDVVPGSQRLAFLWEGRLRELDELASPATFAGTNSGTTGLEGLPGDLKGQRKPRACGVLKNISPKLLNASLRIFGWNFDKAGNRAPTHSIDAVRFRGSLWTFGTDFATAALLAASTPTGGTYNTCKAESLILMGGSASLNGGPVTVDVTIEATAAERYASRLIEKWLLDAGVSADDIVAADLTDMDALAPYEAGYYVDGEVKYREVLDRLAQSIAAVYVPDRLGRYRLRRIAAPTDAPVARFKRFGLLSAAATDEGDLLACEPVTGETWIPAREVTVRYAPSWTPLALSDIADAVSADDRAFLSEAWRTTDPAIDAAVTAQYGNAETRTFDTLLASEGDAEEMRDVFAALFGVKRRFWQATVTFGPAFAEILELGDTVRLTQPRQGMAAGKDFVIHGMRVRENTNTAELKLFG
jgi:hypothetical protein